ncbi:MAG: SH3 domain-containing protein [Lachnospiraceae bacterium]|nr:SH3 domain-containing protein [Lachnospiraceae bacterium]
MMKFIKSLLFDKIGGWIKVHSIISATLLFAVVVACVTLVAAVIGGKGNPAMLGTVGDEGKTGGTEGSELPARDISLQCDKYPDVNQLIEDYHKALADNDEEKIKQYLLYVSEDELINIAVKSEYIESYDKIKCYTQEGYDENSYYVYVSYQLKLDGFETLVPGLSGLYYCPDEAGTYHIYRKSDMSEAVLADFYQVYMEQEVQDLYDTVKLDYTEVLESDENLKTFVESFEDVVRDEVVKRIAIREASEALVEASSEALSSEEDPTEVADGDESETVRATTTVNVRSSDSETADKIGKVITGTTLTRLEEKLNGWSKVLYEGSEGYIKSEYLESMSSSGDNDNDEPASGKYVTVKENVNIRASASETGNKLGLAVAGTKLELIEKMSDGWTKIKYEGQTAYVKSDYVE